MVMDALKRAKISEGMKRFYIEHPEAKVHNSVMNKKYFDEHPEIKLEVSNRISTYFANEENRKKHSELKTATTPRGEESPLWRGGKLGRTRKNTPFIYKQWRINVFKRDSFTCQICKQVGGDLNAHHIKSWKGFPELRYDVKNGITVCEECHKMIHFGGKKKGGCK